MIQEEILDKFIQTKCALANAMDDHGLLKTQLSMFYEFLEDEKVVVSEVDLKYKLEEQKEDIKEWLIGMDFEGLAESL